jgi:SAM-dependent methyltransferase
MQSILRSGPVTAIREALESVVDFELNYGRQSIREFAATIAPFRTVLDIGAGSGRDLLTCRSVQADCELHAIEWHPANAVLLRELGANVEALDIERDRLPFPDGTFDVVIANQILEHVKEIFWVLHNATRVLPIGGHLIVGVPNLASLHNRLILMLGMQPTPINSFSAHVRGFTKHDFIRLLESCWPGGYRLRCRRGGNFYPFPPLVARPLARLVPSMAWGMFLLLRKERVYADEFISVPRDQHFETNFFFGS